MKVDASLRFLVNCHASFLLHKWMVSKVKCAITESNESTLTNFNVVTCIFLYAPFLNAVGSAIISC